MNSGADYIYYLTIIHFAQEKFRKRVWLYLAEYAWTPSALTWLHVNHLINGLHKRISWKNYLYAVNSYFVTEFAKRGLIRASLTIEIQPKHKTQLF